MSDPDAPSTHDHVDVELEWEVGAMRLPDRWRRGVTVVLHPQTALLEALELDAEPSAERADPGGEQCDGKAGEGVVGDGPPAAAAQT